MKPIKPALTNSYITSLCVGLDAYRSCNRLLSTFPSLRRNDIEFLYKESDYKRFTVLRGDYNAKTKKVLLTIATANPIRHLPSNYQSNEFLRNFLMVFQHVFNGTALTLDNIHEHFRPMECPSRFLPVIADWFGVHLDTLGGEDEVRRFLQYAIPLFRFRGTSIGLRAHLAIISGVIPEIIEGYIPFSAMEILDGASIESNLLERQADNCVFTVYFPVPRESFGDDLVRRLSLIVQQEKPVHTRCFLGFKQAERKKRKVSVLTEDTMMDADGGITV